MLQDKLIELGACKEARKWANDFETAQEAWDACERGDWMLWAIGKRIDCGPWTDGRKPLLLCALECAETVKYLWPKGSKDQIAGSVAVLRKWAGGEATVDDAKRAREELCAAYAAYAAYAVAAVANAATAAYAATAANAATAAYAVAARYEILKECSIITRKHYPQPPE